MSSFGPQGEGQNPFENIFGDIARILGSNSQGPLNWDVARQIAVLIAGEGAAEPNVDPLERIRLEELTRVAELHVNQLTELETVVKSVEAVTHVEWAVRTLDEYKPLIERLAEGLSQAPAPENESQFPDDDEQTSMQFAQMQKLMAPMLMGMQAGGMVGHLSRRALGQYDLPIPRPDGGLVMFVPENIALFASDWSLPKDELSLYIAIEEVTRMTLLSKPHVRERLNTLITEYVAGFEVSEEGLQNRLGDIGMGDPTQLPSMLSDPQALLGAIQTPAQQLTLARINAVVAALCGYVDWVVKEVAPRIITSASAIAEAAKRRRVEESDGNRIVERLFGLELNQAQYDRGESFIAGIIERAGVSELSRLWKTGKELPTPAEIDAPGLWLERIDLEVE